MEIIFTIEELNEVAKQIIANNYKKVIVFNGDMGVGKTTIIKQLCKSLGVKGSTSSPTFSLINEYQLPNNQFVYHFDMYRLKSESEALDMGIDDYLYSGNWCFIEWAEKIPNLIPKEHTVITIELLTDGKRKLVLI